MGDNLLYHAGTGWHVSTQLTTEEAAGYLRFRMMREATPNRVLVSSRNGTHPER